MYSFGLIQILKTIHVTYILCYILHWILNKRFNAVWQKKKYICRWQTEDGLTCSRHSKQGRLIFYCLFGTDIVFIYYHFLFGNNIQHYVWRNQILLGLHNTKNVNIDTTGHVALSCNSMLNIWTPCVKVFAIHMLVLNYMASVFISE